MREIDILNDVYFNDLLRAIEKNPFNSSGTTESLGSIEKIASLISSIVSIT